MIFRTQERTPLEPPSTHSTNDRLVVVLGMHRSGTSAMSGSLRALGVEMGDSLLAPNDYNPRGYWEDLNLYDLNEQLLAALSHRWDTVAPITAEDLARPEVLSLKRRAVEMLAAKLERAECFGLKDPRLCRLLGFWQPVFDELQVGVRYVITTRNPVNVAESIRARDGFEPLKSYLLWLGHVVPAVRQTRSQRRVFVSYDQLVDEPGGVLRRVAEALGLDLRESALNEVATEFLTDGLRHQTQGPEALAVETLVPALCAAAYERLCAYASGRAVPYDPAEQREWDRMGGELERLAPLLRLIDEHERQRIEAQGHSTEAAAATEARLEATTAQLEAATAQLAHLQTQLGHLATELEAHRSELQRSHAQNDALRAEAAVLRADGDAWRAESAALRGDRDAARAELESLRATASSLQQEIAALRSSSSWRYTAPLRGVKRLGRTLSGK
jgi:hypothetical protein